MFLTSTEESHLVRKSFSVVIAKKILNSNQEPQEKVWPLYSLLLVTEINVNTNDSDMSLIPDISD